MKQKIQLAALRRERGRKYFPFSNANINNNQTIASEFADFSPRHLISEDNVGNLRTHYDHHRSQPSTPLLQPPTAFGGKEVCSNLPISPTQKPLTAHPLFSFSRPVFTASAMTSSATRTTSAKPSRGKVSRMEELASAPHRSDAIGCVEQA